MNLHVDKTIASYTDYTMHVLQTDLMMTNYVLVCEWLRDILIWSYIVNAQGALVLLINIARITI